MVSHTVSLARGHTESVTTLSLSNRLLCSGGDDGNVYLWSLNESTYPVIQTPRMDPCSTVKFKSRDSHLLYSAHSELICSWDLRSPRIPVSEWKINEDEVNSIDILEDESCLASADDSGAVQILNVITGEVIRTLKKHDNICSVAKFRPGRNWQLVSGGLDCRMIVSDWKGTGLGVIIFELNEIVNSAVDYSQVGHRQSHEVSDGASSGSHASTSEYAAYDYEEFDGTDDEVESSPETSNEGYVVRSTPASPIPGRTQSQSVGFTRHGISAPISSNLSDASSQPDEPLDSTSVHVRPIVTAAADVWSTAGLPINPPMVHSIGCSKSGDFVAAGLEKSTIELFAGQGKRLSHVESLYGHRRAVSALHFLEDSHLISGGNDCSMFLWTLGFDMEGLHIRHDSKINAIEGSDLQKVYIADCSPIIRMLDLSTC